MEKVELTGHDFFKLMTERQQTEFKTNFIQQKSEEKFNLFLDCYMVNMQTFMLNGFNLAQSNQPKFYWLNIMDKHKGVEEGLNGLIRG